MPMSVTSTSKRASRRAQVIERGAHGIADRDVARLRAAASPRRTARASGSSSTTRIERPESCSALRVRARRRCAPQHGSRRAASRSWQRHDERRSRDPAPSLLADDRAAMQRDDLAHERQAQTQPAGAARRGAVALAEAIEDVRQQIRPRCPAPCRSRSARRARPPRAARTSMRPPAGVNFMALESRFAITCARRSGSPFTGDVRAAECRRQIAGPSPPPRAGPHPRPRPTAADSRICAA